jgi:hypothetical protein
VDVVLYSVYTPFPGTGGWARLSAEKRILTTDWRRYDGRHVVFKPAGMSVEALQEGLYLAWNRTYGLKSIARRVAGAATMPLLDLAVNLGFRRYRHTFVPKEEPCESC